LLLLGRGAAEKVFPHTAAKIDAGRRGRNNGRTGSAGGRWTRRVWRGPFPLRHQVSSEAVFRCPRLKGVDALAAARRRLGSRTPNLADRLSPAAANEVLSL